MRRQSRLLASYDVLHSEVAPVGDDIDFFDIQDFPRGLRCLL
jgi:hypothetical protein